MGKRREAKMKNLNDENLEDFIRNNKNKFNVYRPTKGHKNKFLAKLSLKLRQVFINIAPYLIKLSIAIVVIWGISIALWYFFKVPTLWEILKHK
jgi:hypothetical protein